MRSKAFDDFSFKARSQSQPSFGEISSKEDLGNEIRNEELPKEIHYRHLQSNFKTNPPIFDIQINKKIDQISQELEENIKRRLELQKKLNVVKDQQRSKQQRQIFMGYNNNIYRSPQQQAKEFNAMNKKADDIDKLIKSNRHSIENRSKIVEKNKQLLLDYQEPILSQKEQILIPILQKISTKPKSIPVYTVPDQVKIQKLLRKATFPELPKANLQQLRKQVQNLFAIHSPHSDIHFLLMFIYFHLQKFMKVRKNFEEIQNFKNFNVLSYWIAAQAEFEMKNYDLCLKLTEDCMKKVGEKYLPRFIYLKAKSYEEIGNYVNSIICFNQLIKMKPNISQYYLQRGIIYHRVGYYKQAKEDFVTFGIMKPDAQHYIKEKVLCEKNEHRKRQYIALLAKMF